MQAAQGFEQIPIVLHRAKVGIKPSQWTTVFLDRLLVNIFRILRQGSQRIPTRLIPNHTGYHGVILENPSKDNGYLGVVPT